MKRMGVSLIDIFFYLMIIVIFSWALLKSLHIIGSPVLIEMIPYFSIAFAGGAFYFKMNKACDDIKDMKPKIDDMSSRVITLETKETLREEQIKQMNGRLKDMEVHEKRK